MDSLLCIRPVWHEMIWGGEQLWRTSGISAPAGRYGESWGISAHKNGDCLVAGGTYDGLRLSELWDLHPELFGGIPGISGSAPGGDKFPLLVKFIAAEHNLSVQVHPDDRYAREHEHGDQGKFECWYIIKTSPHAVIIDGQKARTASEFRSLMNDQKWDEILNVVPIHEGDFLCIAPGTVHAIQAGTLLLEVQQPSDITYRLYDYDRLDDTGRKRELHIKKALDVIDFDQIPVSQPHHVDSDGQGIVSLLDRDPFSVDLITCEERVTYQPSSSFICLSVIQGSGAINGVKSVAGSQFIATAQCQEICIEGSIKVICSYI